MLTTVFFDLGNTLVDYHAGPLTDEEKDLLGISAMADKLRAWGYSLSKKALKTGFYDPWLAMFPKRKSALKEFDVVEFLGSTLPMDMLTADQSKELLLIFHEPSAQAAVTDEGTQATLKNLKAAGIKLGVISNTPIRGYCHDRTLELLGLLPYWENRLYSYDEGVRKPDRRIFQKALEMAGATPETTVMIGDSWSLDLAPECEMGMRVLHYQSPRKIADEIPSLSATLSLGRISLIREREPILFRLLNE
ncbi:HAD-IA family hydrolase [Bdellovibrionota bacterium FG-2]